MAFKKGQSGNPSRQFGSGQDATKGGRKKKIYTILKEKGYSAEDTKAAFNELAYYTLDELKEVVQKKDTPVIILVVAVAFKKAVEQGDWRKISEIMEHIIGKPVQRTENKTDLEFKKAPDFEWS